VFVGRGEAADRAGVAAPAGTGAAVPVRGGAAVGYRTTSGYPFPVPSPKKYLFLIFPDIIFLRYIFIFIFNLKKEF
jgi:hypothetical protein